MLELDPAPRLDGRSSGVGVVGDLLRRVEQLEHPLGRGDARLQHVDHRRQLRERLGELARVLDERLDVADASSRPDDTRSPPIDGDGDVVEVAEEHHRRLDRARR